jgi:predicted Rossmann fold nucleotide-binding protein DprA/Smf involved in DNA uptake
VTTAIKVTASAVVAILTIALTYYWRHFPPRLALISGLAVGVLVYSTLQAGGRLSTLYRRR